MRPADDAPLHSRDNQRSDDWQHRHRGSSGLASAPLVQHGNVFGWTADEATPHALLRCKSLATSGHAKVSAALPATAAHGV